MEPMDLFFDSLKEFALPEHDPSEYGEAPEVVGQFFKEAQDKALCRPGLATNVQLGAAAFSRTNDLLSDDPDPVPEFFERELARTAGVVVDGAKGATTPGDASLQKYFTAGIHKGLNAARVETSPNGLWRYEFAEDGSLLRGYEL